MAEKYLVTIDGEPFDVDLERDGDRMLVRFNGSDAWHSIDLYHVHDSGLYMALMDNQPTELSVERHAKASMVTVGRNRFTVTVDRWRPAGAPGIRTLASDDGKVRIASPMTGSVVEVRTAPGAVVASGDVLLVIESMKMNNEVRAPVAGRVEAIDVAPGGRVQAQDVLVVLVPDSPAGGDQG